MTYDEFKEELLDSDAKAMIDTFKKDNNEDYYEYLYYIFTTRLERYLPLVAEWRANKDRPNEVMIRKILDISNRVWSVFKKLPSIREYLDLGGGAMAFKSQKDLLDAIDGSREEGKYIAKLYEMQLTRFDEGYSKRKEGVSEETVPSKVEIVFTNGSLTDDEIKEKSGKTFDDIEGD